MTNSKYLNSFIIERHQLFNNTIIIIEAGNEDGSKELLKKYMILVLKCIRLKNTIDGDW